MRIRHQRSGRTGQLHAKAERRTWSIQRTKLSRISGFSGGDPLVILYANDLTVTRQRRSAGAKIVTAMSWRRG
jgi:hypothetical protein